MTEENLILEHLKAIRNEIRDLRREMQAGFKDLRTRASAAEMHDALQNMTEARQNAEIGELRDRIERIERRLDLKAESGNYRI